jgi:hypothetical protein
MSAKERIELVKVFAEFREHAQNCEACGYVFHEASKGGQPHMDEWQEAACPEGRYLLAQYAITLATYRIWQVDAIRRATAR